MLIFFIAFGFILIMVTIMALGVILSDKPIKGTCGGLNVLNLGECEICGGDSDKCEEYNEEVQGDDFKKESGVKKFDPRDHN